MSSAKALLNADEILKFWFEETEPKQHFVKDPAFDQLVTDKLIALHEQAVAGELDDWRNEPDTCLALLILLDQAPRNMFRDTPRAFGSDARAVEVATKAIEAGIDMKVPAERRVFFYLPYEHAEDLVLQNQAVALTAKLKEARGGEDSGVHEFAIKHRDIIERFGRFPHRNAILGRTSTAEETEFLTQPGSSF